MCPHTAIKRLVCVFTNSLLPPFRVSQFPICAFRRRVCNFFLRARVRPEFIKQEE